MTDDKKNGNEEKIFTVPSWINVDLIQEALDNEGENKLKVKDVIVELATAPGDNYASAIYRVKAASSDGQQRSLVIKVLPSGEATAGWCREWGLFEREGLLLGDLIPEMERDLFQALLKEAAPGHYPPWPVTVLAPRCPLQGKDPVDFLVMEDLSASGFRLADRKQGLGLRHSLLALRALARFHAASHALLRRQPELIGTLNNQWRRGSAGMRAFLEAGVEKTVKACRQWLGFHFYADILEKYKVICMDLITALLDPKPGAFNVIIHGDFWVNNMMFRYEDGQPADYRMIDLQLSSVSSPAIDLQYFLSTSVSENVSMHYEDLLVREYYFTLRNTLEALGLEAPSYEALLADMDSHGSYAVWGAINIIPIVKAEKAPDFEVAIAKDMDSINYLFESPRVKRWLERVLPQYVARGWVPIAWPRR